MKQRNKKTRNFLRNKRSFIFLTILSMGIGFAFLTSNLTITGNTSVSGNSWNVYFTNVQVTEGSVDASVVPTTSGTNTTSLDYTVTLDKPGDFYEFTVDAVNNGTIDAMIQNVNMTSLDSDVAKYLIYTVTYLDGTPLAQNDVLEADSSTTYKVRIEFKKNIFLNDLGEDDVNLTLTFGVNYVQLKMEPKTFIELVKNSGLSDTSIDFTKISSSTNGKGLYVMESTKNDTYPIYYYRGSVENNNALFAGYCWKVVRTTETGGTKLVYNGEPSEVYENVQRIDKDSYDDVTNNETYPFNFDEEENNWIISGSTNFNTTTLTFTVKEAGDYYFNYKVEANSENSWLDMNATFYKDNEKIGDVYGIEKGKITLNNLTPSNVISVEYVDYSEDSNNVGTLRFNLEKGIGDTTIGCGNTKGEATQLATNSVFNTDYKSPAYNGYMYGTVYTYGTDSTTTSYVYGNTFIYENGTYTLSDTHAGVDSTHHYTCLSSGTTCESIKYVYYVNGSKVYYITLTGGKNIDDAFTEMNTNTNDSIIKTAVDNWFNNTFKSYFTANSKDYNDYLEDTIWCNDRSMNTLGTDGTIIDNGWKPNGGSTYNHLYYSAYGRRAIGTPTLACAKNDSFTVEESATGNGALTYPVGLLTADEIILAGGTRTNNSDYYLYTDQYWWTMTPNLFYSIYAYEFIMERYGDLDYDFVFYQHGVRPSISLKSGVKIAVGGNGTSAHPYEFIVK